MSNPLFKTTQLTLADFDLHLIKDLRQLLFWNPKLISNLEADRTGKFSPFRFFQDDFL